MSACGTATRLTRLFAIEQEVLHLSLFADTVVGFVRLEVRRNLRVGHGHLRPELVGGERNDLHLDLLVSAAEFVLDLRIRHGDPAR